VIERRDAPRSGRSLVARIGEMRGRESGATRRLELAVATVILGQMLPTGTSDAP